MTASSQTDPALLDWLDALGILRRRVGGGIRYLVGEVTIHPYYEGSRKSIYVADYEPYNGRLLVQLHTNPAWPKIERVELALHAACVAWNWWEGANILPHPRASLCDVVGCSSGTLLDPRERWRVIDWTRHHTDLPVSLFEDRPKCTICSVPIPTGSQAEGAKRPVHEECFRYAHRVYAQSQPAPSEQSGFSTTNAHDTTT